MANTRNGRRNGDDTNGTNGADIAQLMQAFIAALNANQPPPAVNTNHPPVPMNRTQAINEFCKRRPPAFHGEPDPIVAEAWLKSIKVILSTLGIEEDGHRVALAAYQLQGEARYWWELIESTHNVNTMTFAEFENLFLDKYFPAPVRQAKVLEFQELRQGSMTVSQYAAKFEELSRYAIALIPTEEAKARKFEWGLGSTRRTVVGLGLSTYAEVVNCALRLEREEQDFYSKRPVGGSGGPIRTNQNHTTNSNYGPYPARPNPNQTHHQNWKRYDNRQPPSSMGRESQFTRCYNCSGYGHISQNCPHPRKYGQMSFGNQQSQQYQNFGKQPMQQIVRPAPPNQWNGKQSDKAQPSARGRVFALQAENQEQDRL